ncbi:hypothetical protein OBBRIDRAFT_789466 [Obba rivulosa]|uniref:Peroxisomal membrane protein PEX14 n=1 Tax=Obba rivulosa TaxID=1052685 RepID=A0A8E2DRE7_9APHY|nr:hypothetical protein OBBRIDRAFT_789466 [Obba rivulosa]
MSDNPDEVAGPQQINQSQDVSTSPPNHQDSLQRTQQQPDRTGLLEKARAFLNSPQVQHEDLTAKRRFLTEKGLSQAEVDVLLQELPPRVPLVPPRTYPQPPPSRLPDLLVGVLRILSWVAGSSAALLLLYFRFLYPRISQTYHARWSLKNHQRSLLEKYTQALEELKSTQQETFAILPQPEPFKDVKYQHCHTLDELVAHSEDQRDIPDVTVLRCALEDLRAQKKSASTEEIFAAVEAKLPHLKAEGAQQYRARIWESLSTHSVFHTDEVEGITVWSYVEPTLLPPPPLLSSLTTLHNALPESQLQRGRFQHTLKALTDFTGYIATQTYTTMFRAPGMGLSAPLSPQEEELRREIRALKGLVLNRRSFMPNITRPASTSALPDTTPA